jgi:hypothetical protein
MQIQPTNRLWSAAVSAGISGTARPAPKHWTWSGATATARVMGPTIVVTVVAAQLDERISGATPVIQTPSGAPRHVRLPRRIP